MENVKLVCIHVWHKCGEALCNKGLAVDTNAPLNLTSVVHFHIFVRPLFLVDRHVALAYVYFRLA